MATTRLKAQRMMAAAGSTNSIDINIPTGSWTLYYVGVMNYNTATTVSDGQADVAHYREGQSITLIDRQPLSNASRTAQWFGEIEVEGGDTIHYYITGNTDANIMYCSAYIREREK